MARARTAGRTGRGNPGSWAAQVALAALASLLGGCDGTQGRTGPTDPCVTTFPRDAMAVLAPGDSLRQAVSECRGDDGECRAATACQGSAQDRACDAAAFITADAAVCVAHANGLPAGIERVRTGLVYDYSYRRVTWNVSSVLYDGARGERPAGGGGTRGGQAVSVDAVDARVLARFEWGTAP